MKLFYGWAIVGAGLVITCLGLGTMMSLSIFPEPMSAATGWSRTAISTAALLTFLCTDPASFLWGALSDRLGTRSVVLAGGAPIPGAKRNHPRFPESQAPILDNECQHKGDQPKVEKIEHVANRRGAGDQPLIFRQIRWFLQFLQHQLPPTLSVSTWRVSRSSACANACSVTYLGEALLVAAGA